MIIHKEDITKKGYYLCNHAVGKGNKNKITKDWDKVSCKNCLKRFFSKCNIKKTEDYTFLVLPDDTHLSVGDDKLTIMYPKTKFKNMFQKQINDKKKEFISVSWSKLEISALANMLQQINQ